MKLIDCDIHNNAPDAETLYTQGYKVYATINSSMQEAANKSLRKGLLAYDKRHGYRGAVTSDRRRSQRSLLTGDSISATESAREDDLDDDLDDLDRGHTTGLDIFIYLLPEM